MSDGGTDIDTDGAGDAMAMMVMTTRALYKWVITVGRGRGRVW